jgi:hypothetical protein
MAGWDAALLAACCLGAVLLTASVAQDLILYRGPHPDLSRKVWLLDVDVEQGAFTWLSVVVLFSAAELVAISAKEAADDNSRLRWHWWLLTLLFLLASFDELAGLHEKVSALLAAHEENHGFFYFAWAAPFGLVSLCGLVAFIPFIRSFPPRLAVLMVLSAVFFLGGAVGMEMIDGRFAESLGFESVTYRLLSNLEEGLELSGTLLFVYVMLRYRGLRSVPQAARGVQPLA